MQRRAARRCRACSLPLSWPAYARCSRTQPCSAADSNRLNGTLSAGWALPTSLEILGLGANALSGTIPPGLALPPSIQWLSLYNNSLRGTLPQGWPGPGLSRLQTLDLERNALSGSIAPEWLAVLPPSVSRLTLQSNLLSGEWAAACMLARRAWLRCACCVALSRLNSTQFCLVDLAHRPACPTGSLPTLPATLQNATVVVSPQKGEGFCGQVRYACWANCQRHFAAPHPGSRSLPDRSVPWAWAFAASASHRGAEPLQSRSKVLGGAPCCRSPPLGGTLPPTPQAPSTL